MKTRKSFILAVAMAASMLTSVFAVDASANGTLSDVSAWINDSYQKSDSKSSSGASSKTSSSSTSKSTASKVSKSVSGIKKVCGLKSEVETSVEACIVDVNSKTNPYDVVYDYGKDYDAYVAACDWSLVFDANYYAKQFPMLALQYHNDKKLLLKHFQTVGIQEGRQGNSKFNVGVYKANCAKSVSKAFGKEYEGYYFYYMLNYSSQKSVKTTAKNAKTQQTIVKTALQSEELKGINAYRKEAGSAAIAFNSEAAAFANYLAWTNAHDNWHGHDWNKANTDFIEKTVLSALNASVYTENACEHHWYSTVGETHVTCYGNSKGHYETLTDSIFDAMGVSNSYARKPNKFTAQFDTFIKLNAG